jgi:hypothetical protein
MGLVVVIRPAVDDHDLDPLTEMWRRRFVGPT